MLERDQSGPQLDFSFDQPRTARRIWPVRALVGQVRELIEGEFGDVWVEGEISNFRPAPSGHVYFTLKDAEAQLPIVLFRRQATLLRFRPDDGLHVLVRGRVSVYEQRGQMQMIAETPGARVAPPVLTGHGLEAANQVVLGDATLAALHKRVGDTVSFSSGTKSTTLTIVGTATLTPITMIANGCCICDPGPMPSAGMIEAATVAAESLSAIALAMEKAGEAGRLDNCGELLPRAVEEFERFKSTLERAGWV